MALAVVDTSPGEAHSLGTSSVSCCSWWDLRAGSLCLRVGMCLGVLPISCNVCACVHASRSDPAQASVCASVSACGDTCVPGAGWARLQVHTCGTVCALGAGRAAEHVGTRVSRSSPLPKQRVFPQAPGQGPRSWRWGFLWRKVLEAQTKALSDGHSGSAQAHKDCLRLWCGCQLYWVPDPPAPPSHPTPPCPG